MSLKKQYLKSNPVCKVTFELPEEACESATTVNIVGEFNDWNIEATQMKKMKNGSFRITLNLDVDREYQYRYLINGTCWENDWDADKYIASVFPNVKNSVVIV
jgi:1,4-alpha-glucan branching enzyme